MVKSKPGSVIELKTRVLDAAQRYCEVPADTPEEAEARAARLRPVIERLAYGIFRIVVVGEIKKGKTSWINALLGYPDLLPTASDVATSTVYKIIYGPQVKYTVFFLAPSDRPDEAPEPRVVSREELWEYGTEAGNPDNAKNVDFIAVEVPSPLLREGVTIIDTPGLGGLFKAHRDITFRYAPNADAVFFIVDSVEALLSDDEINFLKELRKITKQISFVQTKIDGASTAQWRAWRDRNLAILSQATGLPSSSIPYFPVSSKLKTIADENRSGEDLNDSGFLPVIQYLHKVLIPCKERILALQTARIISDEVAREGRTVVDRLTIAREKNGEKLAQYKKQLTEIQQGIQRWEADQWRKCLQNYQSELGRLKLDTSGNIQDAFSSDAPAFRSRLDDIRTRFRTAERVYENAVGCLSTYAAECSQTGGAILEGFHRDYVAAYLRAVREGSAQLRKLLEDAFNAGSSELQLEFTSEVAVESSRVRRDGTSRLDAARIALSNFSMVGTVTGAASYGVGYAAGAAVAFGLISNPVGWTIAVGAGVAALSTSIWSAVTGYRGVRERHLDAAMANLERAMQEVAHRAHRATHRAFQESATELDARAREGFDDILDSAKTAVAKRVKEVTEAQGRTAKQAEEAVVGLSARVAKLSELAKTLEAIGAEAQAEVA
jgi:hypothetical protein